MAIDIRLKHSSVQDKAPQPSDLTEGELALNVNANSPAAYIKDSAGAVVKLAGAGAVGFDDQWTRTGTELAPTNAGDDVFTSGGVKVGGTTAAPKIELKGSDGTARFGGAVNIGSSTPGINLDVQGISGTPMIRAATADLNGSADVEILSAGANGYSRILFADTAGRPGSIVYSHSDNSLAFVVNGVNSNVVIESSGNMLIGGTLPSAPNISLNANGSGTFAGNLNILGAVSRVYADNTAAKAAGLADGDVYRKADGTLMIVYT